MSKQSEISEEVLEKYKQQYENEDAHWRQTGAKRKAENILHLLNGTRGLKVLDVGSGDGSVLADLVKDKNFLSHDLYSIEISDSGIKHLMMKKLPILREVKLFDGYSIPYPDNFFDVVLCSHVIEHVEHPRILLREIKRVSKKQIFEIPIDFSFSCDKKTEIFLSYGHINIFTPQIFNFLLRSEGYNIINTKKSLYSDEVYDIIYKKDKFGRLLRRIRKFTWGLIPFFMRVKPDTYTVLTASTEKNLDIFS